MTEKTPTLRERQRLTTKSEIVRTAFKRFDKEGHGKISIEMIAAVSGISRATFFNRFPKKNLIFDMLAAAQARLLTEAVQ